MHETTRRRVSSRHPVTKMLAAGEMPFAVVRGEIPAVPRANGLIDLKEETELDIDSSKSGVMTLWLLRGRLVLYSQRQSREKERRQQAAFKMQNVW